LVLEALEDRLVMSTTPGGGPLPIVPAPLSATGTNVHTAEGTVFNGVVASLVDVDPTPQLAASFDIEIHWGDGQVSEGQAVPTSSGHFNVIGAHKYLDEGTFPIHVLISDGDGELTNNHATAQGTAFVAEAPVSARALPVLATEQVKFSGAVARFTDPDPAAHAGSYTATIQWGDWLWPLAGKAGRPDLVIFDSPGTVTSDGHGGFLVSGSHTYSRDGTYNVTVTIQEKHGGTTTVHGKAFVSEVGIRATALSIAATEGKDFKGPVATFRDGPDGPFPVLDPLPGIVFFGRYSAMISWGDGKTSMGTVVPDGVGSFTVLGHHTYSEEGAYLVGVQIKDIDGESKVAHSTAHVADAGLTVAEAKTQSGLAGIGTGLVTLAAFKDKGGAEAAGSYQASIVWGDGTVSAGVVTVTDGLIKVAGAHTYATPGTYYPAVTLLDHTTAVVAVATFDILGDAGTNIQVLQSPLVLDKNTQTYSGTVTLTNTSQTEIEGPVALVFKGLDPRIILIGADGHDGTGDPIIKVSEKNLEPGATFKLTVQFADPLGVAVKYSLKVLANA
jgi:hypothetical protein